MVKNIHNNAKIEFWQQRYPNQLYGSPLNIMYIVKYGKSPNTNTNMP